MQTELVMACYTISKTLIIIKMRVKKVILLNTLVIPLFDNHGN